MKTLLLVTFVLGCALLKVSAFFQPIRPWGRPFHPLPTLPPLHPFPVMPAMPAMPPMPPFPEWHECPTCPEKVQTPQEPQQSSQTPQFPSWPTQRTNDPQEDQTPQTPLFPVVWPTQQTKKPHEEDEPAKGEDEYSQEDSQQSREDEEPGNLPPSKQEEEEEHNHHHQHSEEEEQKHHHYSKKRKVRIANKRVDKALDKLRKNLKENDYIRAQLPESTVEYRHTLLNKTLFTLTFFLYDGSLGDVHGIRRSGNVSFSKSKKGSVRTVRIPLTFTLMPLEYIYVVRGMKLEHRSFIRGLVEDYGVEVILTYNIVDNTVTSQVALDNEVKLDFDIKTQGLLKPFLELVKPFVKALLNAKLQGSVKGGIGNFIKGLREVPGQSKGLLNPKIFYDLVVRRH